MITGISTVEDVTDFFEVWLLKQGLYSHLDPNSWKIHAKGLDLISEDVDFWGNQSMWVLYNRAKELAL